MFGYMKRSENAHPFRDGQSPARHGGHESNLLDELVQPGGNTQVLFVGSLNCLRHKPYLGIGQKMAQGTASILCPSMSDFSTGRYVNQIYDAIVELSQERGCKNFVVTFGCQWVILSTDGELLTQRLEQEHGIKVVLFDDSHLDEDDHH